MFCHCQQLNSSAIKTDSELRAKQYKGESNFQIPALLYCHLSHASKLIGFCWHQHRQQWPSTVLSSWIQRSDGVAVRCSQSRLFPQTSSDFLRLGLAPLTPALLVSSHYSVSRHCSVPWWSELGDAGVGNYCLIPELLIEMTPTDNTAHNFATE